MSPYRWSPSPSPLSPRAQEERSDWDHVFRQWTTLLQQQFPEHLAYLVWDAPRIHALELVADEIMPQYPDWDPALAPVLRRAWINRLTGLGPLEDLLLDDTVSDIMINGLDAYVEQGGQITPVSWPIHDVGEVADLARQLASRAGRQLTTENPLCDAILSDGSRIHLVLPPVSEVPEITIRRAAGTPLSLEDYFRLGSLTEALWEDLSARVVARQNILVAGGAGTGKTSLLRLLATQIPDHERLVTIEDVRELNLTHRNTARLESRAQWPVHRLIMEALRMRPDRIIVGEVRGGEAWDLLEAMATGHPGSLSTVHSGGDALKAIKRLARMAMHQPRPIQYDQIVAHALDTIDVVVNVERAADGHRHILAVSEISDGTIRSVWEFRP